MGQDLAFGSSAETSAAGTKEGSQSSRKEVREVMQASEEGPGSPGRALAFNLQDGGLCRILCRNMR